MHGEYSELVTMLPMNDESERTEDVEEEIVEDEPFTLEKGKEQAVEAVDRVKQAGKEVTTRPILDAIGSYVARGVDALIGLADGIEGKAKKGKK